MFNPRVNTTLHNEKNPNILFFGGVFPGHSLKIVKELSLILCGSVCEEFSVNLVNLHWDVEKISPIYENGRMHCYRCVGLKIE